MAVAALAGKARDMKVLGRYLRKQVTAAVGFVLVGFLALFAFFDFINELDDVGRGGYGVAAAGIFVMLGLASRAYEIMPIAALIGTVYALAQFAAQSEFTAMRAAGMGRRRALGALLKVGLGFVLFTAFVGEVLAPPAERLAQQLRLSALGSAVGGQLRSGLWIKDSLRGPDGAVMRQRFVNIGELMPDTTLRRVKIMEFDPDMRLAEIVEAERGVFRGPDTWQLSGVRRTRYEHGQIPPRTGQGSPPQEVQALVGVAPSLPPSLTSGPSPIVRADLDTVSTLSWRSELNPSLLGVLMIAPDRMSAFGLFSYIRHLRENQQTTDRYEIAFWKKMVYPLAVLVMMALALPFGYLQARSGGVGYKLFAGIMLGVSFHFLNGLFSHLGMLNTWPPLVAVVVPSLTAFVIAVGMLAWVDRTR